MLRRSRRFLSTCGAASAASPAAARAGSQWDAAVTPELAQRLLLDGYCVVQDAFPPLYLRRLRDEMRALDERGQLYPNATHILPAGADAHPSAPPLLLEKRRIVEAELAVAPGAADAAADAEHTPFLRDLYDSRAVLDPLRRALPRWLALSGHMCKLQSSHGGGACFPMHFDSYGHDGKAVTAVLYLNERWRAGDGGELVLYPFPRPRVQIAPRFGTLALFSSQQMLHRVLPSAAPRLALTTWVYCDSRAAAAPRNARARAAFYASHGGLDGVGVRGGRGDGADAFLGMMAKVLRSPFRRHLARLVHDAEWRRSLAESHRHTPQFREYMDSQEREVRVIREATDGLLGRFRAGVAAKRGGAVAEAAEQLPASVDALLQHVREDEAFAAFAARLQLAWF